MNNEFQAVSQSYPSTEVKNKVLRNTYALLAMTLLFSGVVAFISMSVNMPFINPIVYLIAAFGLLFAIEKTKNSSMGLVFTFLFTGFLGLAIGPLLNAYLSIPNGSEIVSSAFITTAAAFLGLSMYTITTKKDFSFLSGFIVAGSIVLLVGIIAGIFLEIPMLQTAISIGMVLFSSALILWQTSAIVNGGETNYISATVTLFVSIFNMFTSLLHLFGLSSDD